MAHEHMSQKSRHPDACDASNAWVQGS